jgi:Pyruvate/2-oxoacid:ferredoxin oxidoreductase gamma subunit
MPTLLHGVYGLGSKDFNKYDAAAVVENMISVMEKKRGFLRDFYVGIDGPLTLKPAPLPGYLERELSMTFIGVGAEGVKTALESAALIYAEDYGTGGKKYVQSGARYGAARKGAPVFMNLRISSHPIRNSSELTERNVLAFFNEKFLSDQILKEYVGGLKEKGLLVINSCKNCYDVLATFPPQIQSLIKYRQIKVFTLDATKSALQSLNRNLPGAAVLGLVNKELGILPEKEFEQRFKKILEKKLGAKKGRDIIDSNLAVLRFGIQQGGSGAMEKAAAALALAEDQPQYAPPPPEDFGQKPGTAGLPSASPRKTSWGPSSPSPSWTTTRRSFTGAWSSPSWKARRSPGTGSCPWCLQPPAVTGT